MRLMKSCLKSVCALGALQSEHHNGVDGLELTTFQGSVSKVGIAFRDGSGLDERSGEKEALMMSNPNA